MIAAFAISSIFTNHCGLIIGSTVVREDTEAEQSESKEKEERPARGSIHEKLQIYKEKSQRESENGREDRKRDFGLE